MLRVGLTGGIASGKSTISHLFEQLNVPVIDTDLISHQLMQPGEEGYEQSIEHFGQSILNNDGRINRQNLRAIVFKRPPEKKWLENMIHPLIRQKSLNIMAEYSDVAYVLLVVPLLFETDFDQLVDHVIAIDCPADIQLQRLISREHQRNDQTAVDEDVLKTIINSQMSNDERLKRADSKIKNVDNQDRSKDVNRLHQYLLQLSQSKLN